MFWQAHPYCCSQTSQLCETLDYFSSSVALLKLPSKMKVISFLIPAVLLEGGSVIAVTQFSDYVH